MSKRWFIFFSLLLLCLAMIVSEAKIPWPKENVTMVSQNILSQIVGHRPGTVFTIYDEHGKNLSMISFPPVVGDYLITSDNRGYTIQEVKGARAVAKFKGIVNLTAGSSMALKTGITGKTVGIYHSHSDESYVPNSGAANQNWGDIYKVGDALAKELRYRGCRVVHSYNNHNPHDAAAYMRSRRTAAQLMRYRPSILIDVHRDAIPQASYYRKTVKNTEIASMRLVVGKQNANRSVNFDFAKMLKAKADSAYPGLVKEIYWARGNYNQDLSPKTILFEFGTHTNTLQECERGATMMANVIAGVLGAGAAQGGGPSAGGINRSGWWTAAWVILLVLVGAGIYLAINSDSWQKIKSMMSKEMTGSVGTEDEHTEENGENNEGNKDT